MHKIDFPPDRPFSHKHLLTLRDYDSGDISQILALALHLKAQQKQGVAHKHLAGKTLAMIFAKSSTRTRVSFEVGMTQLGGYPLFLSSNDIQLGRGEPVSDTAKVLSRMVDGVMIRTFAQSDVEDLARYGGIPVINGLTDDFHPCQILADLMTVFEHKGSLKGLKLAYCGDGNNVAHSLLLGCAKMGINISVACPHAYRPRADIVATAEACASESGSDVTVSSDVRSAMDGADAVYTDTWASMGQEASHDERLHAFRPFSVTPELMRLAKPDAIFLHCLPAYRGEEVAREVIDGPQSVIYDEAENRLHAQKAVLCLLMSGKPFAELMR